MSPATTKPSAWLNLDISAEKIPNIHQLYWWKTSGLVLAQLLHHASYTPSAQAKILTFFLKDITPFLGSINTTPDPTAPNLFTWPSFMTDDGTPIELSWDFGVPSSATTTTPPQIRFSVEPVGPSAGTPADIYNQSVALDFHRRLLETQPGIDAAWYNHFSDYFRVPDPLDVAAEGHLTQSFYAYDLAEKRTVPKAYFFPAWMARSRGVDTMEVMSDAIRAAPGCVEENKGKGLRALDVVGAFAARYREVIAFEMLAIDMVEPRMSRLKLYFRCRDTRFASVRDMMTHGGLIKNEAVQKGVESLKKLWDCLFGKMDEGSPLPDVEHRTAGILYNTEFRLGDAEPSTKIYIPVRHYVRSDEMVLAGLREFMKMEGTDRYVNDYATFLKSAFLPEKIRNESGIHTYIGCSIKANGSLRLVAYINPQPHKIRA